MFWRRCCYSYWLSADTIGCCGVGFWRCLALHRSCRLVMIWWCRRLVCCIVQPLVLWSNCFHKKENIGYVIRLNFRTFQHTLNSKVMLSFCKIHTQFEICSIPTDSNVFFNCWTIYLFEIINFGKIRKNRENLTNEPNNITEQMNKLNFIGHERNWNFVFGKYI